MLRRAERAVTANTNMHRAVSWLLRELQCLPLDDVVFKLEEGRQPQAPLVLQWLQERGSRRAEGEDSAKADAKFRRTEGEDSAQADAKSRRTEKRGEEKRGEEKRGRALQAKHLAQSWFKLHTLTLLLFSLLSMIFECLPPKSEPGPSRGSKDYKFSDV